MKEELIKKWLAGGIVRNSRLIAAFREIKRENFVLDGYRSGAYEDYPLPICCNQTISQPTTIMIMLEALELKETDNVLEIGTGSGYNAALIAKVVKKGFVYTTEIVQELCEFAQKNLKKEKIKNVKVINCDGSMGYEESAPYDKIIVTAAAPKVVEPWITQLKENGIIVAPIGFVVFVQEMIKAKKVKGRLVQESLGYFSFVPLKGKLGF